MRLRNINDIETANAYLPQYLKEHNDRFACESASPVDAHKQALPTSEELDLMLCEQYTRTISKQLEVSYLGVTYQIQTKTPCYTMRHAKLTVCDSRGKITLLYKGHKLSYKSYDNFWCMTE